MRARSRLPWMLRGPRAVVLAVVLALLLVELALGRVLGYGNPRLIMPSASAGYRMVPGQVVTHPAGAEERINSHGYREREWTPQRAAGTRVVVVGDSVCYGVGVAAEQSWPKVLEADLPGCEVLCLCVPGYTVEQMVAAYREDGRPLEPDVVVVELSAHSIRPMRLLREPARYPLSGWIRRSATWDWLRRVSLALPAGGDLTPERSVLRDPYDEVNEDLWAAAERCLDELRAELGQRGARLVLVPTPRLATALEPAREDDRWRAFARAREDVAFVPLADALSARMRPLLEELSVRGVEPARLWKRGGEAAALAPGRAALATFFLDDPQHLDPAGHRVVADRVGEVLAPLLEAAAAGRR